MQIIYLSRINIYSFSFRSEWIDSAFDFCHTLLAEDEDQDTNSDIKTREEHNKKEIEEGSASSMMSINSEAGKPRIDSEASSRSLKHEDVTQSDSENQALSHKTFSKDVTNKSAKKIDDGSDYT